ncbi:MAG: SWIM zinc finger family protein [Roseococcus sp.]|nr:SWIM zinc finger family protein [Roseococcus sp.]
MPRFDPKHLKQMAGEVAYTRGAAYAASSVVTIVMADASGIHALVRASETYRVRLGGKGRDLNGECTCPAFERDGWCKHLVAVALVANDAGMEEMPDRRSAIRRHLVGLGAEALVDMLLDLAERDMALLRRLDLAASAASTSPAEHAGRLRQELRHVLRPRDFIPWDEAADWVEEVLGALEQVPPLIAQGEAVEVKSLIEAVLDDLPQALEQVDDSGGGGTELLERAAELHLVACQKLRPDPVELAEELFEREWDDPFGTFNGASEIYADLLGDAGLATYRRLAEAAYAKLLPIGRGGEDPKAHDRRRLVAILDRFAARDGDVDRRIALRRGTLASAHDHLNFARFCLEQDRPAIALQAAEEGAWLFDDRSATGLVEFLAERLVAEGRPADAIAALWRGFARAPAFSLFRALLALAAPDAADRALVHLRTRLEALAPADHWNSATLVEMELNILMATARLAEAWEAARRHSIADSLLLRLAEASEATLPQDAAIAYRAVIERSIGQTNRGGYEEACRLLARLAGLEAAEPHRAFVAELRLRHRPKRSLLPMLDRHLATLPEV